MMGPTRYRLASNTRASAFMAFSSFVLVLMLAALPAVAGRGLIQDLIFVFYMLALAQCWNLLADYAGLVSVGQQAFVGLGAASAACIPMPRLVELSPSPHLPFRRKLQASPMVLRTGH